MKLRRALHAAGFRYRLHVKDLPGKPDLVFPKFKTALFVHGCFWHRHEGCRLASTPATNAKFWQEKFRTNVDRDKRNIAALIDLGWRIVIVWECEVRQMPDENIAPAFSAWLRRNKNVFGGSMVLEAQTFPTDLKAIDLLP